MIVTHGWLFSCGAAVFAALITHLALTKLLPWLRERQMLDYPNLRSSHQIPTPRGGGMALLASILPGFWMAGLAHGAWVAASLMLLAGLLLAFVCFRDDRVGIGPLPRLLLQFVAVAIGLIALPHGPFLFQGLLPLWLDYALTAIAWVGFINLFNFMDGIDGIAATETVCVTGGLILIGIFLSSAGGYQEYEFAQIGLLFGAAFAFLLWNWHPAKLFLGDVGSVPIGFLLGYFLILAAGKGLWLAALILPLYYLADGGLTLLRRWRRGEVLWEAHREHFYQIAAARLSRHDPVVEKILLCNLCLILIAVMATTLSPFFALLAPLPVAATLYWMVRG